MEQGFLISVLLLMGDTSTLRQLLKHSLMGRSVTEGDETHKAQVGAFWVSFGSWKTADGHCHSTEASYLLLMRAVTASLEAAGEASDAALRAWLPAPAELLHIAEHECVWRAANAGLHPAIECARLHGERLGDWAAAAEVADGLLAIEAFNPLLRVQVASPHLLASSPLLLSSLLLSPSPLTSHI